MKARDLDRGQDAADDKGGRYEVALHIRAQIRSSLSGAADDNRGAILTYHGKYQNGFTPS